MLSSTAKLGNDVRLPVFGIMIAKKYSKKTHSTVESVTELNGLFFKIQTFF